MRVPVTLCLMPIRVGSAGRMIFIVLLMKYSLKEIRLPSKIIPLVCLGQLFSSVVLPADSQGHKDDNIKTPL